MSPGRRRVLARSDPILALLLERIADRDVCLQLEGWPELSQVADCRPRASLGNDTCQRICTVRKRCQDRDWTTAVSNLERLPAKNAAQVDAQILTQFAHPDSRSIRHDAQCSTSRPGDPVSDTQYCQWAFAPNV